MKNAHPEMRVFELMRDEDISGVSGVGRVAVGVVFPSGKVVLEWLGSHRTFGIYDNLADVERIHGHGGKTRIVFMWRARAIPYLAQMSRASPAVFSLFTNRSGHRRKIRAIWRGVARRRLRLPGFHKPGSEPADPADPGVDALPDVDRSSVSDGGGLR
jgi:hypothetical protein